MHSPSFVAFAFQNGSEDCNSDLRILNGNDFSISILDSISNTGVYEGPNFNFCNKTAIAEWTY